MSSLTRWIVKRLRVVRDSLVPHQYGARLVSHSALAILSLGDVVEQELEKEVRLLLIVPNDLLGVYRVDIWTLISKGWSGIWRVALLLTQRLLAGHGVDSHDRVFSDEFLPPHHCGVSILHLLLNAVVVRVDRGQAF